MLRLGHGSPDPIISSRTFVPSLTREPWGTPRVYSTRARKVTWVSTRPTSQRGCCGALCLGFSELVRKRTGTRGEDLTKREGKESSAAWGSSRSHGRDTSLSHRARADEEQEEGIQKKWQEVPEGGGGCAAYSRARCTQAAQQGRCWLASGAKWTRKGLRPGSWQGEFSPGTGGAALKLIPGAEGNSARSPDSLSGGLCSLLHWEEGCGQGHP